MNSYALDLKNGWCLAADESDLARWQPEEIVPRISSLIDKAANVKVCRPSASNEQRIKVMNSPDCIAILVKYPPNSSGVKGLVWIGLENETQVFWHEAAQDGLIGRFRIDPPTNPELN